jgi:hypothetical protein
MIDAHTPGRAVIISRFKLRALSNIEHKTNQLWISVYCRLSHYDISLCYQIIRLWWSLGVLRLPRRDTYTCFLDAYGIDSRLAIEGYSARMFFTDLPTSNRYQAQPTAPPLDSPLGVSRPKASFNSRATMNDFFTICPVPKSPYF